MIPNFVDTEWIRPAARDNGYRRELGLERQDRRDVRRQRRHVAVARARARRGRRPGARPGGRVRDQRRGSGAARSRGGRPRACRTCASSTSSPRSGCPRCWPPPTSTWCRCERGLGRSSVPSKTVLDPGRGPSRAWPASTAAPRSPGSSSSPAPGVTVPPDDPEAFTKAITRLVAAPDEAGPDGRSPDAVSWRAGPHPPRSPRSTRSCSRGSDGAAR